MNRLKIVMLLAMGCILAALPGAALAAPVAQGGVIFMDGTPNAIAVVFDGETLISDAQLTINDIAMTSDGDGAYSLELNGVQAGDTLVFKANDASGNLIYTSSGVVPAELILNKSNLPTTAGEEFVINWECGCGASAVTAEYADLTYGMVYSDDLTPEAGAMTVPAGVTYEGNAIFAASAISGDTHFLNLSDEDLQRRSYFMINRSAYLEATLAP